MFVIGITGGIACGKSMAADYFRKKDLPVVDADRLSHQVTSAGGAAVPEIMQAFGADYILPDGGMDRDKMSRLVFADKKKLDLLAAITHRHILLELAVAVDEAKKRKEKAIVLDVPLPVQHGFLDLCHYVIVVWASLELRLQRLQGRGMDPVEAGRRIAMQMTEEEYAAVADLVLMNNGSVEELESSLEAVWERELRSRGIH